MAIVWLQRCRCPCLKSDLQLCTRTFFWHTQHIHIQTRHPTIIGEDRNQQNPAIVEHHAQLPAVGPNVRILHGAVE